MRFAPLALVLPLLAACTAEEPVAIAPPLPVPPGCAVDPATRLTIAALPIADVIQSAPTLGLPASDVLRLFAVQDGSATATERNYVAACLGVKL